MHPEKLPAPGQRTSTALLHGSSDAPLLAALAARARPLLVITESAWQAQRLLQEIPFFAPQLRVHMLPDWETLPYDHFSPHHDLVSERLATLCQMVRGDVEGHWLTPEEGRRIIKDGKAQMVYTPPQGGGKR